MNRQSLIASVAGAALLLGVSACGGDDDQADPKPTRTTASASPTPTTPTQPQGAYGITYQIQNWKSYAEDPAVLAWKTTLEGVSGAVATRKLNTAARKGLSKKVLRQYTDSLRLAWKNDWHLKGIAYTKIGSSKVTGSDARLTVCLWNPSVSFYQKNGKASGPTRKRWEKQVVEMKQSGGRWVVMGFAFKGTCSGGAPT